MKADPIAEAVAAYDAELARLSEAERLEVADWWRRQRIRTHFELAKEVTRAYFRRLNRMGVAIDPRGALFMGPRAAGKFRMIRL